MRPHVRINLLLCIVSYRLYCAGDIVTLLSCVVLSRGHYFCTLRTLLIGVRAGESKVRKDAGK